MEIGFKERSWLENMLLVFSVCRRLFLPLFLASLVIGLPAFVVHYLSWIEPVSSPWQPSPLPGYASGWAIFLDYLEIPFRQGVCLYLVGRCYEGFGPRFRAGWLHVSSCLPSLFAVTWISVFVLFLYLLLGSGLLAISGVLVGSIDAWIPQNIGMPFDAVIILFIVIISGPMIWAALGLALSPATTVMEHRDPLLAVGRSFELASGNRWYLISFLGLLCLPTAFAIVVATFAAPRTDVFGAIHAVSGEASSGSVLLVGLEILKTAVNLPANIAPAILYFHFTAKARRLPMSKLAQLVDKVGARHGHS